MSRQGTIKRYSLIIEKINTKSYPSLATLKDFLYEHGFCISDRTLQRDIEQIRHEFGIEITYSRKKHGYAIDEEKSINTENFQSFLEIVNTAELLNESLQENAKSLEYMSFDQHGSLKGTEHLKPLLNAIKLKRKVSFKHISYISGEEKKYTVDPYLLKEYQSRWYLIGLPSGKSDFFSFGIDRMSELVIKDTKFHSKSNHDPRDLYNNIIGLNEPHEEPEEVLLSFTPLQGKYIKSLPLHRSQEVIHDNNKELLIKLHIVPNFEFKQRILMLGAAVKVIKPKWFIAEIKKSLKAALRNYK